jgi:hypothetical protein
MKHLSLNHTQVVARVDKLVVGIINSKVSIDVDEVSNQLEMYYERMLNFYDTDTYQYTETIEWFLTSTFLACGQYYPYEVDWSYEITFNFIKVLTDLSYRYPDIVHDFAVQERRNSKSLYEYVSYFLKKYSRVLIVRVDLKIQAQFFDQVDIETFHGYMEKLTAEIARKRGCFENLRGHAWAIEQGGVGGGLHSHLLLIYNGDKRWKDWSIAEDVGVFWLKITDGIGEHENLHFKNKKDKYREKGELGIGMIHKDNATEVKNALYTALYLTRPNKFDQRLKVWMPKMHSFGKGVISEN